MADYNSSILEIFGNADYTSEKTLHEMTMLQMQMQSPEYAAARRSVLRQIEAKQRAADEAKSAAQYAEIRKNAKLNSYEAQRVHDEAARKALADFNSGKIGASEIDTQTKKHEKQLTEAALDRTATNAHINALLRGQL